MRRATSPTPAHCRTRGGDDHPRAPVRRPVRPGYADLIFEITDGLVLVDHKSDTELTPQSVAHYRAQLAGYAELLGRATGRVVVRQVLLHVPGATADVVEIAEPATS